MAKLIISVVIAHEGGHYVVARATKTPATTPMFVPLGVGVLGMTVIARTSVQRRYLIYAAGPLLGMMLALSAVGIGLYFAIASLWRGAAMMAGLEAWTLTAGGDGKKIRAALKEGDQ